MRQLNGWVGLSVNGGLFTPSPTLRRVGGPRLVKPEMRGDALTVIFCRARPESCSSRIQSSSRLCSLAIYHQKTLPECHQPVAFGSFGGSLVDQQSAPQTCSGSSRLQLDRLATEGRTLPPGR